MRRFLVSEEDFFFRESSSFFKIRGKLFHHIFVVLRHKRGDFIELITEKSNRYKAEIIEKSKRESVAKIIEKKAFSPLVLDFFSKSPNLKLCLSLSRFKTMERVIEKSVELGVHSFQPFISDFSFLKKKNKITEVRQKRWLEIMTSASQQSNHGKSMRLEEVLGLEDIWSQWEGQSKNQVAGLFAYEGDSFKGLQSIFSLPSLLFKSSTAQSSHLKEIWLFVGSEGGFSKREVEGFFQRRLPPISLGPRVLKVETACLSLVSIIKYELGKTIGKEKDEI